MPTSIPALSGTGAWGGKQQTNTIVGQASQPTDQLSTRQVQAAFTNGDGDTVEVTFKVTSQSAAANTDFIWPAAFDGTVTIAVAVEEEV